MMAVGPFWRTTASLVFLLAGAIGAVAILLALGRSQGAWTATARRIHRAAGWVFVLLFYTLFVSMLVRVGDYWEEFPPRVTAHITLAIMVFLLLALKAALPRFLPNLGHNLFFVGIIVYVLSFPMVLLTAGHYLLSVRILQPYVYHANLTPLLADERLGKELLISRCSTCHTLEKVLKPRSRSAWESVMSRMVLLSPRVSPGEASQILHFLTKNYLPREAIGTGRSLIEKHCLPCHHPSEILTKDYSKAGWRSIVLKMNGLDANLVPEALTEELVTELLEATKHNNRNMRSGLEQD